MPEPILFLVDDDPATLKALAAVLERRFGADYRILIDASPASALARIEKACKRGEKVALVVADLWTSGTSGPEWLVRVSELCPGAGRCVLVGYGDANADPVIRRAFVLGQADTYLVKPWGNPEERLYPVVSEMLGSWGEDSLAAPGGPSYCGRALGGSQSSGRSRARTPRRRYLASTAPRSRPISSTCC